MWNSSGKAAFLATVITIGAIVVGTDAKSALNGDVQGKNKLHRTKGIFVVQVFIELLKGGVVEDLNSCDGAIIANRYVLISGNCLVDTMPMKAMVLGYDPGNRVGTRAVKIIRHPKYSNNSLAYNLAILEFGPEVDLAVRYGVISLPTREPNIGAEGSVHTSFVYFVMTDWGANNISVSILNKRHCPEVNRVEQKAGLLCANITGSFDYMAVGSPIVSDGCLVGIPSNWHIPYNIQNIYYYLDWINEVINQNT